MQPVSRPTAILRRLLNQELFAHVTSTTPTQEGIAAAITQLEREIGALATFVPEPVIVQHLNTPTPGNVSGAFWEGSILFADLSGFTALSGTLSRLGKQGAEEISSIINALFDALVVEISMHGGALLKFGGDALTAFFDAHTLGGDHAHRACHAALSMQKRMTQFSALGTRAGIFRLQLRIGVHSGRVFAAHVGDQSHIELVITGEDVNRVALAQEIARSGEIVISDATRLLINDADLAVRRTGFFHLCEVQGPVPPPIASTSRSLIEQCVLQAHHSGVDGIIALAERIAALEPYLPHSMPRRFLLATESLVGEFRPVTTLFIHFWPFSDMLTFLRHNPSLAAQILNTYYQRAQEAIHQFGGIVNKVDMYTHGDKLMALFGAPFAHEDDAERAVRAALIMRHVLEAANAEISQILPECPLHIHQRAGINTGIVFAGLVGGTIRHEYTVMGQAVNLAARLMSSASEQSVVISPATRRAVEHRFLLHELPPVNLKGIEQPVAIAEVVRPLLDEKAPQRRIGLSHDVVGRVSELAQLTAAGQVALGGSGRLVVLIGEAGVGKTCLIDATLRRLAHPCDDPESLESPYRLLQVASESYNQTTPFNTLRQLLRLVLIPEAYGATIASMVQQVHTRVTELVPDLERFIPLLGEILGLPIVETSLITALSAEQRRDRRREMIAAILLTAAHQRPHVIILDDLHWIDASSLDLLATTFEQLATAPLLILAAHRPEPTIHAVYRHLAQCLILEIGLLSSDEGRELIRRILGSVPPPELEELLLAKSHGNPYFIEEFLHGLRDNGELVRTAEGYHLSVPASAIRIPDSIEGVITARLDRLEEQTHAILQVASVIGQHFTYAILAHLVSRADTLSYQLDRLDQAALIAHESSHSALDYLFRHALIRDVTYESLLFTRRRELHQRIAQIIEAAGGADADDQLSLLARHYLLAEQWSQAFTYHVRAGRLAQKRFANREAITFFTEAMKLLDQHASDITHEHADSIDDVVIEVHERLGWLYNLVGNYDLSLTHYEVALAMLHATALIPQLRLFHHIARVHEQRADYETSFAWISRAEILPVADTHPIKVRCLLLGAGMHARQGRYQQALELTNRALEAAEQDNHQHNQAHALKLLGNTWINMGENGRAREVLERAVTLYRSVHDLKGLADALNDLATLYHELGELEAARTTYEEAIELAQTVGDVYSEAMIANNLGDLFKLVGRYDAAVEQFERSLRQFTKLGSQYGIAVLQLNLGATWLDHGDLARAATYFDRADHLLTAQGAEDVRPELERYRAQLTLQQGDLDGARVAIEQALETAQRLEAHGEEGITRRMYAQILATYGDHATAWIELERSLALLREADSAHEICRTLLMQADLAPVIGYAQLGQGALDTAVAQLHLIGARHDLDTAERIRTRHGYH
ncbi:adenylate/guanylate cyclase domain-containing protein [Candidatus Oscillochloris fontis]|uniref:adenylate/guanylate cyclase domain-containing protein n=1 Tax=Candidatus Oscillochloris fontis TaxID=2496868 RepID=UPI00101B6D1D|nr:adenylate/guanylate cyclase domain-containing protein [Candidatus Oscillochloris fontis]